MSSKGWNAACTGVQARASAQKSPDFTSTRRDSGFALPGKGRPARAARAGADCVVANPRNSTAITAVLRGWAPPRIPSRKDTVAARGDFEQVLRPAQEKAKSYGFDSIQRPKAEKRLRPQSRSLNSAINGKWSDMRHQMRPRGTNRPQGVKPRA